MLARVAGLRDRYRVSMWVWNGMPLHGREICGWMFGRGRDHAFEPCGDALGLSGQGDNAGKLILQTGNHPAAFGRTVIPRWTWSEIALVRDGNRTEVFLNGNPKPEISVSIPLDLPLEHEEIFIGGRGGRDSSWEGRIDEVAIFRSSP